MTQICCHDDNARSVTAAKMQLVEASHHFLSNTVFTVPKSHIDRMQKHKLFVMGCGSVGAQECSSQSQQSDVEGSLVGTSLGALLTFFCNFPLLATKDRCCTSECIHLLLTVIYNHMKYRKCLLTNIHPQPPTSVLGGILTSKRMIVFINTTTYLI